MGLLVIPHLHPQGGFDALNDLAPVASVATVPMVLAVSNASGFNDLKTMLAHMRQNPGKVNLGSGGPGTTAHLAQALFLNLANVQGTLVQYRGTGPALIDVIAGTIEGIIDQTVTLMPLHADKRARAIAVSAPQRLPRLPDVPTFAEAGLPQFDLRIWNGLVAPKGTPRAALDRLAAAVSQVMDSPEYVERVEKQFASEIPSTADRPRWVPAPSGARRLAGGRSGQVNRYSGQVRRALRSTFGEGPTECRCSDPSPSGGWWSAPRTGSPRHRPERRSPAADSARNGWRSPLDLHPKTRAHIGPVVPQRFVLGTAVVPEGDGVRAPAKPAGPLVATDVPVKE